MVSSDTYLFRSFGIYSRYCGLGYDRGWKAALHRLRPLNYCTIGITYRYLGSKFIAANLIVTYFVIFGAGVIYLFRQFRVDPDSIELSNEEVRQAGSVKNIIHFVERVRS